MRLLDLDVNKLFREQRGKYQIKMNTNLYCWVLRTTLLETNFAYLLRKFNLREIMDGAAKKGHAPRVSK